jgi:hypothetical protein
VKLSNLLFALMLAGIVVLVLCVLSRAESWEHARHVYLREHPTCEACGAVKDIAVHHILPRENGGSDDQVNLISLCDPHEPGQDRTLGCHWIFGHNATSFSVGNSNCRNQAAAMLRRRKDVTRAS